MTAPLVSALWLAAAVHFGAPAPVAPPEVRQVITQTEVSLASSGDGSLAVWHDHRGIVAGRIDRDGRAVDRDGIVVGDGTSALVVWTGSRYLVIRHLGATLAANAVARDGVVGAARTIANENSAKLLDVAASGTAILLLLENRALLLDHDGTPGRVILAPNGWPQAGVASDGAEFLVAAPHGSDVIVYRVSAGGDLQEMFSEAEAPTAVRVGYGAGQYTVAWGANWGGELPTNRLRSMTVSRAGERLSAPQDDAALPRDNFNSGTLLPRRILWRAGAFEGFFSMRQGSATRFFDVPLGGTNAATTTPGPLPPTALADAATEGVSVLAVGLDAERKLLVTGFVDRNAQFAESDTFAPARTAVNMSKVNVANAAGRLLASWTEEDRVRAKSGTGQVQTLPEFVLPSATPMAADIVWFFDSFSNVSVRRYTADLEPIDTKPIVLPIGVNPDYMGMAAAGRSLGVASLWFSGNATVRATLTDGVTTTIKVVELPGATDTSSIYSRAMTVVWTGSEFLFVWSHPMPPPPFIGANTPVEEIRFARVTAAGDIVDLPAKPLNGSSRPVTAIRLAASGGRVTAIWNDGGLRAMTFTPGGTGTVRTLADSVAAGTLTAVAGRPDGFVVAWTAPEGVIQYRTIDMAGNVDPFAGAISGSNGESLSLTTVGDKTVLAYAELATDPVFGKWTRALLRTTTPPRGRAVR